MSKIVESKVVFKSEDQLSASLKSMTDLTLAQAKATEELSHRLKELEQIQLRPEQRPSPRPRPPQEPRGAWYQRAFRAGEAYTVGGITRAREFTQAGLAGQGVTGVSGMLSRVGAGIPYLGIPLLAMGAGLGLLNLLTGPAREWGVGTAHLQRVLGEGAVREMRTAGAAGGYTAQQTQQFIDRLYKVGAQEAWKPMAAYGYGAARPEHMMAYMETITKGMPAGARIGETYGKITKGVAAQVEMAGKTTSVVELMDLLVGLAEQQISVLGEINDNQERDIQVMAAWMNLTGSAMMRGQVGAGTMGRWAQWITNPRGPGQTMLLYSTLMGDPSFRAYAEREGILPRGARTAGMYQFMRLRELPRAPLYAAQRLARREGGMTEETFGMLFGPMGIGAFPSATIAGKAFRLFRDGKDIDDVEKELAAEIDKEKAKKEAQKPKTAGDILREKQAERAERLIGAGERLAVKVETLNTTIATKLLDALGKDSVIDTLNNTMRVTNDLLRLITGENLIGGETARRMERFYPETTVKGKVGRMMFNFFQYLEKEKKAD